MARRLKLSLRKNSTFIQSTCEQWFVCGYNSHGQLGLGHNTHVHTPIPLSLPNDETIKTVIMGNYSTFIQSTNGLWFICGFNENGELGLGHKKPVLTPTLLSLPLNFCSSLTTAQTTDVDSLINIVSSQNPITIADFLGKLLLAYAKQSITDSSLANEMASTLLRQQPSTYSACVRLIQNSGLLEAAAKLPDTNDDSLSLLRVCKKLYDKDFPQRVEDILSQAKTPNHISTP